MIPKDKSLGEKSSNPFRNAGGRPRSEWPGCARRRRARLPDRVPTVPGRSVRSSSSPRISRQAWGSSVATRHRHHATEVLAAGVDPWRLLDSGVVAVALIATDDPQAWREIPRRARGFDASAPHGGHRSGSLARLRRAQPGQLAARARGSQVHLLGVPEGVARLLSQALVLRNRSRPLREPGPGCRRSLCQRARDTLAHGVGDRAGGAAGRGGARSRGLAPERAAGPDSRRRAARHPGSTRSSTRWCVPRRGWAACLSTRWWWRRCARTSCRSRRCWRRCS